MRDFQDYQDTIDSVIDAAMEMRPMDSPEDCIFHGRMIGEIERVIYDAYDHQDEDHDDAIQNVVRNYIEQCQ